MRDRMKDEHYYNTLIQKERKYIIMFANLKLVKGGII